MPEIINKKAYLLIKVWTDSWVVDSEITNKIIATIIIPRAGSNLLFI
tara:strand:+ start:415 stop:555 length:141 start_codon:yes stop_codon:yes gene_type:complete